MRELHTYALTSAGGGAWPTAPAAFASTLVALLRTRGDLRPLVGFTNDLLAEVAGFDARPPRASRTTA